MNHRFTIRIVIGMLLGIGVGILFKWHAIPASVYQIIITDIFQTLGTIFIALIKMMVVPIVFVSLVCGSSSLGDIQKFGRVGGKTLALYLLTTAIAVALALLCAKLFHVGDGLGMANSQTFTPPAATPINQVLINMFPANPVHALARGFMLQIIVFSILLGLAMAAVGESANAVVKVFQSLNTALMHLITMIMKLAPYGVFCLLAVLFSRIGYKAIFQLLGYFATVLFVLLVQLSVVYPAILQSLTRLSPITFYRKMRDAMLFAFSVSSSNASIPVVLKTVEKRLGVKNTIASFIIPLGSTINMDGTAIMQGVATIFIANVYHVDIGIAGYLTVIGMATLASIGTAGVPSVGLITLAMVLEQVGLPVQGIGLIIGIDRLLDMARTAVNVSGDSMIATVVAKSEDALDIKVFEKREVNAH
ncbi:MAG: dicarboxylate/amino acid:cation symporter [Gammaproteobacteria bacterium]|nr:dicarboxylate/amino acid:cation symporter [Gammaproteobacteria bacterium]MCH9744261.1 dicarboxylate/amino acid:cation symporter [Gammaproteobacteria bacterium]